MSRENERRVWVGRVMMGTRVTSQERVAANWVAAGWPVQECPLEEEEVAASPKQLAVALRDIAAGDGVFPGDRLVLIESARMLEGMG